MNTSLNNLCTYHAACADDGRSADHFPLCHLPPGGGGGGPPGLVFPPLSPRTCEGDGGPLAAEGAERACLI